MGLNGIITKSGSHFSSSWNRLNPTACSWRRRRFHRLCWGPASSRRRAASSPTTIPSASPPSSNHCLHRRHGWRTWHDLPLRIHSISCSQLQCQSTNCWSWFPAIWADDHSSWSVACWSHFPWMVVWSRPVWGRQDCCTVLDRTTRSSSCRWSNLSRVSAAAAGIDLRAASFLGMQNSDIESKPWMLDQTTEPWPPRFQWFPCSARLAFPVLSLAQTADTCLEPLSSAANAAAPNKANNAFLVIWLDQMCVILDWSSSLPQAVRVAFFALRFAFVWLHLSACFWWK